MVGGAVQDGEGLDGIIYLMIIVIIVGDTYNNTCCRSKKKKKGPKVRGCWLVIMVYRNILGQKS